MMNFETSAALSAVSLLQRIVTICDQVCIHSFSIHGLAMRASGFWLTACRNSHSRPPLLTERCNRSVGENTPGTFA